MRIEIKIPASVLPDLLNTMGTYRLSLNEAIALLIAAGASELTPGYVERLLEVVRRPDPPLEAKFP